MAVRKSRILSKGIVSAFHLLYGFLDIRIVHASNIPVKHPDTRRISSLSNGLVPFIAPSLPTRLAALRSVYRQSC